MHLFNDASSVVAISLLFAAIVLRYRSVIDTMLYIYIIPPQPCGNDSTDSYNSIILKQQVA